MGNVKIKKKAEIEARKLEQEKKKLVRMLAKEHGLI